MKRVLCVVSSLNAGGAETFLMKVFRVIDRSKYMFDFIVCADGIYDDEVRSLGGKIFKVSLRTKNPLKTFVEIKNIVKENKYNYFFKLADTPIALLDILAAKVGGAKWISVRSCNAGTNSSVYNEILYALLRPFFNAMIDCKIAPSDLAAEYTFGKKQVANGNVHFINNGVDLKLFQYSENNRNIIRKELHIPSNAFLVGHIGRFNYQKNHEYLLRIFEKLYEENSNVFLLLVGTGELELKIKNLVTNSNYKDNVIFTGLRRDIPKLLSAMDLFILPSFYEGMPNVIIEAQAIGLPCLVSDTITKEADITGLVKYLSIEVDPNDWALAAISEKITERKNTKNSFNNAGYDITSVTDKLITLLFQEFKL